MLCIGGGGIFGSLVLAEGVKATQPSERVKWEQPVCRKNVGFDLYHAPRMTMGDFYSFSGTCHRFGGFSK